MSKGVYDIYMMPGETICEFHDLTCRKPAIGEFTRTKRELRAGWPNKEMPISLCKEHAGDRVALTKNELDKISLLIFDLAS